MTFLFDFFFPDLSFPCLKVMYVSRKRVSCKSKCVVVFLFNVEKQAPVLFCFLFYFALFCFSLICLSCASKLCFSIKSEVVNQTKNKNVVFVFFLRQAPVFFSFLFYFVLLCFFLDLSLLCVKIMFLYKKPSRKSKLRSLLLYISFLII